MVKQALKASADSGRDDDTKQLTIPPELIKDTYMRVQELRPEIKEIVQEEREEKELRRTEMELTKGENMLQHEQEIHSRPARTWFQSQKEKERAKETGKKEYNDKMDGENGGAARARREAQPQLNHKQRRRKEALDELKVTKNSGNISSAIRNAKKEMRPGAISQMGADTDKRGSLANGKAKNSKSKPKKGKGGGFKVDLGEKKKAGGNPAAKASKTAKAGAAGPGKKTASSLSRGKKGKR